jgi:VWFA-related protein
MKLYRHVLVLSGLAVGAALVCGQDSANQASTTAGSGQSSSAQSSSTQNSSSQNSSSQTSSSPQTSNSPQPTTQDQSDLPSAPSASRVPKQSAPPPAPVPAPPAASGQSATPSQPAAQSGPGSASQGPGTGPDLGAPPDSDIGATIRQRVNEVPVVFIVTDKHGHYISDLHRDDFQILDNNQPPAAIRSFSRETNLPLEVGLLVDASNSVRDRFTFEQDSAIEFLNQTVRPRFDRAFVVGFDVTPEVTQDFTDNTELLSRGVRSLRPGGGTAMFDALYFACRDKLLKTNPGGLVRRAIILLSDGDDNQSHVTREEAIDMADRAGVIVYTISTNVTGSPDKGDKVLERIADATGGRAFFPFQLTDIATNFQEIQEELRNQYMIAYSPANFRPDGQYHTIELKTKNHKDLKVRARRGYYAPTE